MLKQLSDDIYVSGQLLPEQVADLAAQGVKTLINNRPDGEVLNQPSAQAIAMAAQAAGLVYEHIPLAGSLQQACVQAVTEVYAQASRPIVSFCGSGLRSTLLWAVVHVGELGIETTLHIAQTAGYNLTPMEDMLQSF